MNGKFYLIPVAIHPEGVTAPPEYLKTILQRLRFFVVEDVRTAQQMLKKMIPDLNFAQCEFLVFNEHSQKMQAKEIIEKIIGKEAGLLSEAGVPCVADPGSAIVALAHQNGVEVIPLVGPSSILLALMASGLNGQRFVFHGYLPKDKEERERKLRALEQISAKEDQTQIFMEAPYRNQKLFEEILVTCHPKTWLCVAADLTASTQFIKTLPVERWRKEKAVNLDNRPALFLLQKKQ